MENSKDFKIILCNTDSISNAKEISKVIIKNNLAACVNIINNVISVYEWEGKVVEDSEFTLLIKSHKSNLDNLESAILKAHTYDTPEIITFNIEEGNSKYLTWMREVMKIG